MRNIDILTDIGVSTHRSENEDSFLGFSVDVGGESLYIAIVCDGLGGMGNGSYASNLVVTSVANFIMTNIDNISSFDELKYLLVKEIQSLNTQLYNANQEKGITACTTIVLGLISSTQAYIFHSGDSRAYKVSNKDEVTKLTVDHSYVEYLYQNNKIDSLPSETSKTRSQLISCLGFEPTFKFSESTIPVQKLDTFIFSSDGFWAYINPSDLIGLAHDTISLSDVFQEVIVRGSTDNITAVVIRV